MSVFNVGFVIFPDLTQLDFTGPQQVLARLPGSAMHIIVDAILAGTQPRSMTVQTLLGREMPLSWPQQRVTFGFAPA